MVDGEAELCLALAGWFQTLDVNLDGAHFFLDDIRYRGYSRLRTRSAPGVVLCS